MPTLSQPVTAHNLTAWFIVAPPADAGVAIDYAVLESATHFSKASDLIASKKTLLAMRLAKSQHDVWLSVAEEQELLAKSVHSEVRSDESPTSLQLTYENEHVTRALEDYGIVLEHAPAQAGGSVIGVVWAINGVPSHADRYASPTLFAKLWRKLLRAAATEAIVQRPPLPAEGRHTSVPTAAAIQDWLEGQAAAGPGLQDEQLPPRTLLRTARGESRHRFEAFDTACPAAGAVHVAVLSQ